MNSDKNNCELQRCEDLTSECEKFVLEDNRYKCVLNEGKTKCELKEKKCEEFDPDKCDNFNDDYDQRCILDTSSNKCRLIKCDTLSSSECTKFPAYDESQICAPIEDKCQIIDSCSKLSEDVCETIKFNDPGEKCIYSDKNGCEYSSCWDLKSNCEQFVPLDTLYKCTSDKKYEGCVLEIKDCEELSKDQCDLFNTEEILEDYGGKRCIEDNGKCVLASKKLDISLLLFSLFLFLF